jgi:hypothetical protein
VLIPLRFTLPDRHLSHSKQLTLLALRLPAIVMSTGEGPPRQGHERGAFEHQDHQAVRVGEELWPEGAACGVRFAVFVLSHRYAVYRGDSAFNFAVVLLLKSARPAPKAHQILC